MLWPLASAIGKVNAQRSMFEQSKKRPAACLACGSTPPLDTHPTPGYTRGVAPPDTWPRGFTPSDVVERAKDAFKEEPTMTKAQVIEHLKAHPEEYAGFTDRTPTGLTRYHTAWISNGRLVTLNPTDWRADPIEAPEVNTYSISKPLF